MSQPAQRQHEETIGGLVHQLTEQIPELIRGEARLAQAELTDKGKRAGMGVGMFSVAGLLAFFGAAAGLTASIGALALVLPLWASALIVAGALFLAAAIAGLVGRKRVKETTPVTPERAMHGVRDDLAVMKGGRR